MTIDQPRSEDWHAALASSTRRRVLELLVDSDEALDAIAVAAAMSQHVTTARFHLEQLEAVGLVQREVLRVPGRRGRPRVLFSIPPSLPAAARVSGAPQADVQEQLSRALISVLNEDADGGRARAIRAGENWSRTLPEPVLTGPDVVAVTPGERDLSVLRRTGGPDVGPYLRVLGDLGFAPELQGERVVALRECPFREEARQNPGVVCSVHLGLMRGERDDDSAD